MKKFIKRNRIGLILILPGALLGFLYWHYIGCNSGTCPITSVWYNSSLYGALLGFLGGNFFDDRRKKRFNDKLKHQETDR